MPGRVIDEDRRKAKAALGELGEVQGAVNAVAQLCADERARALDALRKLTPPSSATLRDLSMWDMMMVMAMQAIHDQREGLDHG